MRAAWISSAARQHVKSLLTVHSRHCVKVGLEAVRLEPLHLSVLDSFVVEVSIQLDGLIGDRAIFILWA